MQKHEFEIEKQWQIIIFIVNGKANHVGLLIPNYGFADLSLLGARIIPWNGPSFPKGEQHFFKVYLPTPEDALSFLQKPGLLTLEIIKQEKKCRGWHLTHDAPDFVRLLRNQRSRDPSDMNCVEWIVYAMELGGLSMSSEILTPTELLNWCKTLLR